MLGGGGVIGPPALSYTYTQYLFLGNIPKTCFFSNFLATSSDTSR